MKNIYRQGDILLKSVSRPKNLKSLGKFNSYVLAYGERTGHQHILETKIPTGFEILEDEKGQKYLKLFTTGKLKHPEHKEINLLPDFYMVINEREYDYSYQKRRRVQD